MIQAVIKKGKVLADQVPAPFVSPGCLLIKVINSCISAGTEVSGVQGSGKSLIRRALDQPDNLKKVVDMVKSEGIAKAYSKIRTKLDVSTPTGYSLSGIVIGVGKGVQGFQVGDAVAAAGAGVANHAEYVDVPVNLVMKMPVGIDFPKASTVALGSIAMQGVRRANLSLGEFGVVLGTGILGLLTVQMLSLAGIRVIAVDLDDSRLQIAMELGAELIINPNKTNSIQEVENLTGGFGADAVIFTAATNSSSALSQSFAMCKRKGKVVMVGVSGMEIKRDDMFSKELDFVLSTSYGPGRYDSNYEAKGLDYPYAYVRWTENRNMTEYLRLVSIGAIQLDKLIMATYPIDSVTEAFESLQQAGKKPLMVILTYGSFEQSETANYLYQPRRLELNSTPVSKEIVNVALIGAGEFAVNMHLPNLVKLSSKFQLLAVMNRTGLKAKETAQQYKAKYTTTRFEDILQDNKVDLVLITTRHQSHAELALQALKAGKHVFVEKPLAIDSEQLNQIKQFYEDGSLAEKPILMIGFNRRFSAYAQEIKKHTDQRINPLIIYYRMNAGFMPANSWVHEDGGRIIGEACHIIDLMTYFTKSSISSISVESLTPSNEKFAEADNKSITLKYADGSVCTISYFACGSKELSKEYMEVHFDGKTIVMDNYTSLKGYGVKINEITTPKADKGHLEELNALHQALRLHELPISLREIFETTEASFLIASSS